MKNISYFLLFMLVLGLAQCASEKEKFVVISGSENKSLEGIVKEFGYKNGYDVEFQYKGSVDIMLELQKETVIADAVWPANSFWISLGDKHKRVRYAKSIMASPVVLGVKKDYARKLALIGKDVRVKDVLDLVEQKKLKFMMTSATQSNSGASFYLSLIYALSGGHNDINSMITTTQLDDSDLKSRLRKLLSGVNRSSQSSGFLKELFLKAPQKYDAMVNYEALIIETNIELEKRGLEPLYVVYLQDATAVADSPLGFIDRNDSKKAEFFKELQSYLLAEKTQNKLSALGRRTGFGGVTSEMDANVFNPNWGINPSKILTAMQLPSPDVIRDALILYQLALRKPSITAYCLDFSGSMSQSGEASLKEAMKTLLVQEIASKYLLQAARNDITIIIPFSDSPFQVIKIKGNSPSELAKAFNQIDKIRPTGGTDIYTPVIKAFDEILTENMDPHIPAVVLMTDGRSNVGNNFKGLLRKWTTIKKDIPVFPILFGQADKVQLEEITTLTMGKVFDGRKDLIKAFRKAKGQN